MSARSSDAILRATLDLLAERGFDGLSVDAVAAQAGVGKATIYRHWGSRAKLVYSAAMCLQNPLVVPDTGTLEGDLEALLRGLVHFLFESDAGRVLPTLVDAANRDPELAALRAEHVRGRRENLFAVFRRAVERGELDPATDLERAADLLAGPAFYRRLMSGEVMHADEVAGHVELVLRALGVERRADA